MNTLAVFRNRSDTLSVYSYLKNQGIACAIVNTPSRLRVGCGLSIVFHDSMRPNVDPVVRYVHASSFVGYFPR